MKRRMIDALLVVLAISLLLVAIEAALTAGDKEYEMQIQRAEEHQNG